ncbi:MAG: choice-of-anchor D domain-containing protein [Bradymonadales bacterium]|nr:choice-of-anchor D domain-containing protein [Bradymonadales bacterium]
MKLLPHALTSLLLGLFLLPFGCGSEYGQVSEGDISVTLNTLVFPQTRVGGAGRNVQFSIRNSGDGPLLIQNIEIVDSSPYIAFSSSFLIELATRYDWRAAVGGQSWTAHPPFTLEAGREIQVDVLFNPETTDTNCPGGDTQNCGEIIISSNDRDEPTVLVGIRLEQSAGLISVDQTVVRFPSTTGGPYLEDFTISNQGSGPLTIQEVTDPGVAGVTMTETSSRSEPYTLEPGAEAVYRVQFAPQAEVEYCPEPVDPSGCTLGEIEITSDDANGTVVTVILKAGGVGAPDIAVSTTELVFEAEVGNTDTQTVDVTNEGESNLNWNLRIDPQEDRSLFSMKVGSTTYSTSGAQMSALAPSNSRTVELTFTPADDSSVHSTLVITSTNDPDEPYTYVHLYGGAPAAELEAYPSQLFFPVIEPGTSAILQLLLTNNGRATLHIESGTITSSDNFSLDPVLTGMEIAPGGGETVEVSYNRPTEGGTGLQQGTLTIVSDALWPNDNLVISLFANNGETALPPTAVITVTPSEPYSVDQSITLDAGSSTPPEGGELVTNPYSWMLMAAPLGSRAYLSNTYMQTTTLTPDLEGTYTVMLTVTAALGPTVTTQAQVTRNLYVE